MSDFQSSNFKLNARQKYALKEMLDFVRAPEVRVFILTCFGRTSRTTLLKNFIFQLQKLDCGFTLFASTSRAAKIHWTVAFHSSMLRLVLLLILTTLRCCYVKMCYTEHNPISPSLSASTVR